MLILVALLLLAIAMITYMLMATEHVPKNIYTNTLAFIGAAGFVVSALFAAIQYLDISLPTPLLPKPTDQITGEGQEDKVDSNPEVFSTERRAGYKCRDLLLVTQTGSRFQLDEGSFEKCARTANSCRDALLTFCHRTRDHSFGTGLPTEMCLKDTTMQMTTNDIDKITELLGGISDCQDAAQLWETSQ